jgi:hypothetical protein
MSRALACPGVSSERNDMELPETCRAGDEAVVPLVQNRVLTRAQRALAPSTLGSGLEVQAEAPVSDSSEFTRRRRESPEPSVASSLRCVWTGYLQGAVSCRSCVPERVVLAAWRRELQRGAPKDRFFRFTWQDSVWLAYGVKDGRVRGVYCPSHSADRDERSGCVDSAAAVRVRDAASA